MWNSLIAKIFAGIDHHQRLTHVVLILLVGTIVYSNSLSVPFYFDDVACIAENPFIHNFNALFHLENYREFGLPEDIRNNMVTRFVAYASFALNYRLHGLALPGYHIFNIALHLLNAVLVYQFFRLTLERSAAVTGQDRKGALFALVTALIFVAHPVQTNAVTYVVQRFSLLATLFYLFALIAYIKAAVGATHRYRRTYYLASLVATTLAMYTKEISFTLPVMIALYDLAFLDGDRRIRLRRLAPVLATLVLIPATVMTLSALSTNTGGNVGNALDLANISGQSISRWDYFITQWRVIVTYLHLLLWPVGLNFDYDYPVFTSLFHWEVLLSGLLVGILSLTGIFLLFCQRCNKACHPALRLVGFGLVWFFLTLVMESSIIRLDDLIFEYRLYLPAVGFIAAVVALGDWGRERLNRFLPPVWARFATTIICVALVGSLGVATILRNNVWNDPFLLWQDTATKSPQKSRPLGNLANEYCVQGRFSEALPLFEKAKTLDPNDWIPPYQLGQIYLVFNQPAKAIDELTQAVRINAAQYPIWLALGYAYLHQGLLQEAANAYKQVLILKTGDQVALQNLEQLRRQGIYPANYSRY